MTPTLRWSLVSIAALIISVAFTACAGPGRIAPTQPSSGVSCDLVYIGGPAPSAAASSSPSQTRVTAFTLDRAIAAVAAFPVGKDCTLLLEPGTYHLVSKTGDARCLPVTVTVLADRFQTVKIRCRVK